MVSLRVMRKMPPGEVLRSSMSGGRFVFLQPNKHLRESSGKLTLTVSSLSPVLLATSARASTVG